MTECYYYYNIIWEIFSYLKYIRLYLKGLNRFFLLSVVLLSEIIIYSNLKNMNFFSGLLLYMQLHNNFKSDCPLEGTWKIMFPQSKKLYV